MASRSPAEDGAKAVLKTVFVRSSLSCRILFLYPSSSQSRRSPPAFPIENHFVFLSGILRLQKSCPLDVGENGFITLSDTEVNDH